ncbi:class I SAM-dependent methyltransferase [Sphingobium sufflavum]|uniref:class I SAM-dependent methyltransferase n=1 Tax=Sphingobium sufflavum TaxID=1129547 RepID=UPI00389A0B8B
MESGRRNGTDPLHRDQRHHRHPLPRHRHAAGNRLRRGPPDRHFLTLARHVTGIDISANALRRAAIQAPGATYREGDLTRLRTALPLPRYDVATLCEMLYYLDDPATTLAQAQDCADTVVVTIYEPQAARLAPPFAVQGWRELPVIAVRSKRWRVYHWTASYRPPRLTRTLPQNYRHQAIFRASSHSHIPRSSVTLSISTDRVVKAINLTPTRSLMGIRRRVMAATA